MRVASSPGLIRATSSSNWPGFASSAALPFSMTSFSVRTPAGAWSAKVM